MKYFVITFVIVLMLFMLYIYAFNLNNQKVDRLFQVSESISEAKEAKALVAIYKLKHIDKSVQDFLNKEKLSIDFDTIEYWIEKEYHISHEYIFLKRYYYFDNLRLVIEDPTSLRRDLNSNREYNCFLLLKIDGKGSEGSDGMGGHVRILKDVSPAKTIELEVFFYHSFYHQDIFVGKMIIEKQDNL